MASNVRFGKKLSVPPTSEIKHEMRLMDAADKLSAAASVEERNQIIRDLACKHGLSNDRAQMLVDRFGIGRLELEGAAQNLHESKA